MGKIHLFIWMFYFLCSFTGSYSYAQKHYLFNTYTIRDGLLNNTIYSINQDRKGYMWFATDIGVSRFDGYRFDNTIIPEINKNQAFVQYIEKNTNGYLSFATFMQGVIAEKPNGTFKQYLWRKKQLGKNVIRTLKAIPDDKIIFTTGRNINVADTRKDTVYQIYDYGSNTVIAHSLEYDANGNIWFGGEKGVGVIFSGEKKPYFLPEMKDVFVIKILFAEKNKLLIGTQNGYYEINVTSRQKNNFTYTVSRPFPEMNSNAVNDIYKDRIGDIWVVFVNNGLFRLRNNRIINHITQQNGLPTAGVMCVFQDNELNYWFGTSSGICCLNSFSDYSYHIDEKNATGVNFFAKDAYNRLWMGTNTELAMVDGDSLKRIHEAKTFLKKGISALKFYDNKAFFFTNAGLWSMPVGKNMQWTTPRLNINFASYKLNEDKLRCFYFDDNSLLWLGFAQNAIRVFRSGKMIACSFPADKECSALPSAIVKDKFGNYWVGDFSYGLYRFSIDKKSTKDKLTIDRNILAYKSLKPDSAFATAWIQDLKPDLEGNIWMASLHTGVYKLQIDASGVTKATLYSTANGLSSNDIYHIGIGADKSVWLATVNGADRIIFDKNGKEKVQHYNDKTGFGHYAFDVLPSDSVTYVNYEEGIYAIDNHTQTNIQKPLKALITNISVMGKTDTMALTSTHKVYRLAYNKNFIAFDYGVVTFSYNQDIVYQYKLEGIDKNWSEYSDRRYVSYNSLPFGNYTFMVRAKRTGANENGEITYYRFRINTPFYFSWWFILLLMLMLAAIGFWLYYNKIKQLRKVQTIRTKIASDLHDDIGSTLSSISLMSEIAQNQMNSESQPGELIREIGNNAHLMLENMDDIIWAVKPANDKFQNLEVHIREYAIPLFESKNIQFRFFVPDDLNTLPLSMEVRRNLFLIAKEAVNNLVKYSGCTQANIIFAYTHAVLTMEISDNGTGFDANQQTSRNGLRNMKQRAAQIGGKIEIVSEKNKGTKIRLTVKII